MSLQCETCWERFENNKTRRNHVATVHKFLTVLCPYCTPVEVTVGRVGDLRRHIAKKHPGVTLPNAFFTDANGFYMATNPLEYARYVRPAGLLSVEAKMAMDAVKLLVPSLTSPSRSISSWIEGWKQAESTPLHDETLFATPLSPFARAHPFTSVKVQPPTFKPPVPIYSPTRPAMYTSPSEIVGLEGTKCIAKLSSGLFLISLQHELRKFQPKQFLVTPDILSVNCRRLLGSEYYEVSTLVAPLLQLTEADIGEVSEVAPTAAQAINLLSLGCMPLFPPARRQWSQTSPVTLTGKNGETISWPPKEPGDDRQRRLNFMSAAIRLDSVNLFPASSEDIIFDKFNFLVLPGTATIPISSSSGQQRFFNYKTIVNYVKHGKDEQLAKMLISGSTSRSKDTDYIISKLSHIPLRI